MTSNSGYVMITLEQSLTMALASKKQMHIVDIDYLMLKPMLKNNNSFLLLHSNLLYS